MRRIALLLFAVVAMAAVRPASADDISVGSCFGVRGVHAGPDGVSFGGAWVTPNECLGPR